MYTVYTKVSFFLWYSDTDKTIRAIEQSNPVLANANVLDTSPDNNQLQNKLLIFVGFSPSNFSIHSFRINTETSEVSRGPECRVKEI